MNIEERHTSKYKYIVGPVNRFDQKYEMYKRARGDETVKWMGDLIYGIISLIKRPSFLGVNG
jgi:hypothetical protein